MMRLSAENRKTLLKLFYIVMYISVLPKRIAPNFILSMICKTVASYLYEWLTIEENCYRFNDFPLNLISK